MKKERITFQIEKELKETIERMAVEEGRSVSGMLNVILKKGLKEVK